MLELVVAVAIFTIVAFISISTLLSVLGTYRKTQAVKTIMDNLSFALDSMSRAIRVGTDYECSKVQSDGSVVQSSEGVNCPSGGDAFKFTDSSSQNVIYYLHQNKIWRKIGNGDSVPLTSPEVTVERLKFYVSGALLSDNLAPKVIMSTKGYAGVNANSKSTFEIQTTVAARVPE